MSVGTSSRVGRSDHAPLVTTFDAAWYTGRRMAQIIGRTTAESTPAFDPLPRPPDGAPNVVVIVLDDLGFAQLGCFGGDVDTPAIDRLAAGGLRYRSFHVTALCSPTRACVLTGRNHHADRKSTRLNSSH